MGMELSEPTAWHFETLRKYDSAFVTDRQPTMPDVLITLLILSMTSAEFERWETAGPIACPFRLLLAMRWLWRGSIGGVVTALRGDPRAIDAAEWGYRVGVYGLIEGTKQLEQYFNQYAEQHL